MRDSSYTYNFKVLIFLFKIIFCCFVLFFTVSYIGKKYEIASSKNHVNQWNARRFQDFYNTPKNTIDMIFVGSSHSYTTFDPEIFDSRLNINTYQMGMPNQTGDGTYYTVMEILNYQKPRFLVMELYWDVLKNDFDLKQVDYLFKVLDNEELKKNYINTWFPLNERVKYYLKPVRYQQEFLQYTNNELLKYIEKNQGLKKTIVQFEGEEYYRSKGFIYCDYVMSEEDRQKRLNGMPFDAKRWEFSSLQKKSVENIAKLCKENEIQLIFVTAPISNVNFSKTNDYDILYNKMSQFANSLDVKYLDFNIINREENMFSDENFRDGGHLNFSGTVISSEYFINWFLDNFEL